MKDQRFAQIIHAWMERRGFRRDQDAADALGLDRSVLNKYKNADTVPSFGRAVDYLQQMGGDFRRALPGYNPADDVDAAVRERLSEAEQRLQWPVAGEVEAATSQVEFFECPDDFVPELGGFYERSPLWRISEGSPVFLRHRVRPEDRERERYQAYFAIRPLAKRIRLREGPEGKIYAVARLRESGESYFGTWMRVYDAGFYVYTPAARIVGELDVANRAWSEKAIEFTHVVLGVASYNIYDPQPEILDGAPA